MAAKPLDPDKAERKLARELGRAHAGMLGLTDAGPRHFQPMTALRHDDRTLYFFVRKDGDLAKALAEDGGKAMFNLVSDDGNLFACIAGELRREADRPKAEALWRKELEDWLPEGRTDANLLALRFDITDAEVWHKRRGPARFAYRRAANSKKAREERANLQ